MKHFLCIFLALFLPLSAHAEHRLQVVASFSIIGDFVRQVAGDNVDLKTLVRPDGDVHEYEPTPADAKNLANADIVFVNGLGLEGWIERLIASSGFKGKVVVLSKGLATPLKIANHDDPHAWQNPLNAILYAENIRDALIVADPANAEKYRSATTLYVSKLTNLDAWAEAELNKAPAEKRKVISQHDSFQYFSLRYGIQFIAPQGLSTDSQPSAADMAKIIDQIRSQHITVIFIENMSDPRLVKQLEQDAGAHIGGTLYSDALSRPQGVAPDYIAMFRHNVTELAAAMQADPKQ